MAANRARNMGRLELLAFVNDFLETDYVRVEQCADGVAYAQFLDALFPGKVPLHRLNFYAKHEEDFLRNLVIVQESMEKIGLQKEMPVERLSKAKFQDNNEFLQWCVYLVTSRYSKDAPRYPAHDRRVEGQRKQERLGLRSARGPSNLRGRFNPRLPSNNKIPVGRFDNAAESSPMLRSSSIMTHEPSNDSDPNPNSNSNSNPNPNPNPSPNPDSDPWAGVGDLLLRLERDVLHRITSQAQLKDTLTALTAERDFYFNKLRRIEVLCKGEGRTAQADALLHIVRQSAPIFEHE